MRESCPVYCYSGIQSLFEVVLLYTFYTFGDDAKGLIAEGNLVEVKRLKFLRTALETKYSELQSLDREIVDLVDDVEVIDTEVCESCELMSSIQECIVELESVLEAQESKGKSQKSPSVVQPVSPESAGTSQGHVSKAFTHAKLPKLELKKFHGNPMHWYPFWESFESAVHKNPNLSSVEEKLREQCLVNNKEFRSSN